MFKSPTYLNNNDYMHKFIAFTLAETLVVLGIIGVIAKITLPSLVNKIQINVKTEKTKNVNYKITTATDLMKSEGLIGAYPSTDAFLDVFSKHIKIMKRCSSSNITDCWPTNTILLSDGSTYAVSNIQSGLALKKANINGEDWGNTAGFIMADGTPVIFSFNKNCQDLEPYKSSPIDGATFKSSVTNCMAAIFDINGSKGPNKAGDDIQYLNVDGIGRSCAFEIGSLCFGTAFIPTPLTAAQCEEDGYAKACKNNSDYWAGAMRRCHGKLPSMEELAKLATTVYNSPVSANESKWGVSAQNMTPLTSIGLPTLANSENHYNVWSSYEIDNEVAYMRRFYPTYTQISEWGYRYFSDTWAICLE